MILCVNVSQNTQLKQDHKASSKGTNLQDATNIRGRKVTCTRRRIEWRVTYVILNAICHKVRRTPRNVNENEVSTGVTQDIS